MASTVSYTSFFIPTFAHIYVFQGRRRKQYLKPLVQSNTALWIFDGARFFRFFVSATLIGFFFTPRLNFAKRETSVLATIFEKTNLSIIVNKVLRSNRSC